VDKLENTKILFIKVLMTILFKLLKEFGSIKALRILQIIQELGLCNQIELKQLYYKFTNNKYLY
jgi:hypothetical protein